MAVIEKEVILKAVTDPSFGKEIFSQLPGAAFSGDEELKEIYLIVKNYYRTHNEPVGERTLLSLVEEKMVRRQETEEKMDKTFDAVHKLYEIGDREEDSDVINQQVQRYVRKTLSASLLRDTLSKSSLDDDGVIEELSDKLKQIAVLNSFGNSSQLIEFFEDTEQKKNMYKNMKESRFSTGFQTIDTFADGGLARGELGLIIAQSGGGKSTWGIQQTTNYVKRGMNVLYVVLEEKMDRMLLKVEQNFLGISKDVLFDENSELKEEVFDATQDLYKKQANLGKLIFSKHNPQEVTLSMLEQIIIDASIRKDITLDAVIIDYPDLMKNHFLGGNSSESDAGGKLYEGIRALAQKYGYVCWVLSQLNRSGYGQEVKTAEAIEGSKRKLNAVEIAFTLNQTPQEFKEGFLRIHVDKLRYSSGNAFDKMQYFRIERSGLVIRDETPEELQYHKSLVNAESGNGSNDDGYDKANHMVTNINDKL